MKIDNSFFEDQVRDGFYIPGMIKRAWGAELEVLSEIDRVCTKHNIEYFADWGSLLATVRHAGFIPWDDDLDIVMKRSEYERFLLIAEKELPEGYDVYDYKNNDDYWLYICRVVGKKRICFEQEHLERFHQFPYIAGVDIFVLDNISDDEEEESLRDALARYAIVTGDKIGEGKIEGKLAIKELKVIDDSVKTDYAKKYEGIYTKFNSNVLSDLEKKGLLDTFRRELYLFAEKQFDKFNNRKTKSITQLFPFGMQNKDFKFPSVYYEKSVRLPYEGITVPVPICYNSVLNKRYGNYMKLVKNAGAHGYPFFEAQHEAFVKLLDFELPSFKFDRKVLEKKSNVTDYKRKIKIDIINIRNELISQINGIQRMISLSCDDTGASLQNIADTCVAIQNVAIELGKLCESLCPSGNKEDLIINKKLGCSRTISLLEKICEVSFIIFRMVENGNISKCEIDELKSLSGKLLDVLEKEVIERKTVVFVCYKAESFKYYKAEFDKMVEQINTDVFVVPIPYFYKNYDGTLHDMQLCTEGYPQSVELTSYEELNLKVLEPDSIYIQYPYDQWNSVTDIPTDYYALSLRENTNNLIYIPWFETDDFTENDYRQYHNLKDYALMPGVIYADKVLLQSQVIKDVYVKKLTKWAGEDTKDYWETKISVYKRMSKALSDGIPHNTEKTKKLLYHVELSSFASYDNCLEKIRKNVELFELQDREKLEVVWFQDDVFEDELKKNLPDHYSEYKAVRECCVNIRCVTLKKLEPGGKDEKIFVGNMDVYYGDACRLAMLMNIGGKPVMISSYEIG